MRIVDTSAWIEWLLASSTGVRLRDELPDRSAWLVPTIVQLELGKWLARTTELPLAERVIALTQECQVATLDSRTAIRAAEICRDQKLPTADAVVYATAIVQAADLLTCDAHFEGLPQVIYIPKG